MRTQSFGPITIDRIVEQERYVFDPPKFFNNADTAMVRKYRDMLGPRLIDFATDSFIIGFHSYLIRTPKRTILVDTCNGNHKPRPGLGWQNMLASDTYLRNMAALGLRPEDIDMVLCTHLHGDHVGWNTTLIGGKWLPTFPKAKYVMAAQDYRFFTNMPPDAEGKPRKHLALPDSIAPVIDAGQAELVDVLTPGRYELDDGVWLEPSPGHTPGHVVLHVSGGGRRAVLCGDIIHHPIQFFEPQLVNGGDIDPALARRTRDHVIETAVNKRALLLTGHFPTPTAGYLAQQGDAVRFAFDE